MYALFYVLLHYIQCFRKWHYETSGKLELPKIKLNEYPIAHSFLFLLSSLMIKITKEIIKMLGQNCNSPAFRHEATNMRKHAAIGKWSGIGSMLVGLTYRKHAAIWEVVQNRVNACGVAYRTVDELKEKLVALKMVIKDQIRDQKITGGGKPIPMPDYENVVVSLWNRGKNVAKPKRTFLLCPHWHRQKNSDFGRKLDSIMLKLEKLNVLDQLVIKASSFRTGSFSLQANRTLVSSRKQPRTLRLYTAVTAMAVTT